MTERAFSSKSRNKRLQLYGWWTKPFWSASKTDMETYDNIRKIKISQGDNDIIVFFTRLSLF